MPTRRSLRGFVAYEAAMFRTGVFHQDRSREEWADDAWEQLMSQIYLEGACMREGSPTGAALYAEVLSLAVKYMHSFPDDDGIEALEYRVRDDLNALNNFRFLYLFEEEEKKMIHAATEKCAKLFLELC